MVVAELYYTFCSFQIPAQLMSASLDETRTDEANLVLELTPDPEEVKHDHLVR